MESKKATASFATLNTGANTGASIPLIGLGTASESPEVPYAEKKAAIHNALEVGYRHFDTASLYGSESFIGEALTEAIEAGSVKRGDLFITTKIWCTDNFPQGALPALKKSLSTLQLDYVDLCLIHFPIRIKEEVGITMKDPQPQDLLPFDMEGTWKALEDCFRKGLTKAIGVSNFSSKKIMDLIKVAEIPPSVNQVEMHPLWHQKQLRETCKRFDIHVSAWSPLGAPRESWGSPDILNEKVIKEIAAKRGKSPAQVALRWGLDNGVSVIPKSFNRTRMEENLQVFGWHLTEQDHEAIGKLKQRRNSPAYAFCHPEFGSYKTIQDLWDGEA